MHAISRRTTQPEKAGAVRQSSLHSQTPQHPHVSLNCFLRQGRHGHRLEEGALGYSIRKPQDYNCLHRFSPAFYRGTHHLKIGRSLDFVQPGVGLLPSLHLYGVSVLHRIRPPRCRHVRTNISLHLQPELHKGSGNTE